MINSEQKKAELDTSIRGTGWRRSKYVLFRSIPLFLVFWNCIEVLFSYFRIYIDPGISAFISTILSIYLPLSYYNRNKSSIDKIENVHYLFMGLLVTFFINYLHIYIILRVEHINEVELFIKSILNLYVISAIVVQVIYLSYLAKKSESNP